MLTETCGIDYLLVPLHPPFRSCDQTCELPYTDPLRIFCLCFVFNVQVTIDILFISGNDIFNTMSVNCLLKLICVFVTLSEIMVLEGCPLLETFDFSVASTFFCGWFFARPPLERRHRFSDRCTINDLSGTTPWTQLFTIADISAHVVEMKSKRY